MKKMKISTKTVMAILLAAVMVSCKKSGTDTPVIPPNKDLAAISIADLKAKATGAEVKLPDGFKITGTVISDAAAKNIEANTIVVQEADSKPGIVVKFNGTANFAIGDKVEINVSGQSLAIVNAEKVLNNIPTANAKKLGTGAITARIVSGKDLAGNGADWDGTLVTLPAGMFSGADGKYNGNLDYTDSTGTFKVRVLSGATFENTAYPSAIDNITGIVRQNGAETFIDLRNPADVASAVFVRVETEDFTQLDPAQFNLFHTDVVKTRTGDYYGVLFFLPGNRFDAGFTEAGKNYLYLFGNKILFLGNNFQLVPSSVINVANLKSITITFAASKVSGDNVFQAEGTLNKNVKPFNMATDTVQIGIASYGGSLKMSPVFKETGKFYTVTINVPTFQDYKNTADYKNQISAGLTDEQLKSAFEANRNPVITNFSTRKAVAGQDAYDSVNQNAPILIEKISYNFTK